MSQIDLSLIIPAKNEEESIEVLYQEITDVLSRIKKNYEIIFLDDGSTDNTFQALKQLNKTDNRVKVIKLRGNCGKSAAFQTGFNHAHGNIIFTLDADLQDNPKEIPAFLEKIEEGYDLVSGWKKVRHDPSFSKVLPSRIVNFLARRLTGIQIHDTNCGFKAYKREVIENLNLYGELYRFIPIIAAKQNFKVGEVVVDHRPRKYGKTKFGWSRGVKGLLDLVTVIYLTGYVQRPGHFFGTLGLSSFSLGFLVGLYITFLRLTTGTIQDRQPLLFLGILLMIVGIQLVSLGLLGEMITYWRQKENTEKIVSEYLS